MEWHRPRNELAAADHRVCFHGRDPFWRARAGALGRAREPCAAAATFRLARTRPSFRRRGSSASRLFWPARSSSPERLPRPPSLAAHAAFSRAVAGGHSFDSPHSGGVREGRPCRLSSHLTPRRSRRAAPRRAAPRRADRLGLQQRRSNAVHREEEAVARPVEAFWRSPACRSPDVIA